MSVDFSGKWKHLNDEHFEDFLKAAGVGNVKRKLACTIHPKVEIIQDGEHFKIIAKIPLKKKEISMTVGKERTEKDPLNEDKEYRLLDYMDGDKLVSQVLRENGVKITREIVDGKLIISQQKGDVICKQTFERQ